MNIAAQALSEQSRISLITCAPGEELYARYGHTAIRVSDPENQIDWVFNYGIFSFNTDHFYWRFIKGETYYQLGAEDYVSFIWEYICLQREIEEQILNLTLEQRQRVLDALLVNYRPENRYYLYNFVFDNCATRPYLLIKEALADSIHSTYDGWEGRTYREFIRHYTRPYSWENFGINLLFGPRADRPMHGEQRLFLPEELMNYLSAATLSDGTPLVLEEYTNPFEIAPTPWYDDYRWGLIAYALLVVALSLIDRRRGKLSCWWDISMLVIYLIIIAIVTFLTFFSLHPLVGFGWRLLILPLIHLCARSIYFIRR